MVILFYMNNGKSGISVFPYCMLLLHRRVFVLCFSVYTIMQNKYVLYTLEIRTKYDIIITHFKHLSTFLQFTQQYFTLFSQ